MRHLILRAAFTLLLYNIESLIKSVIICSYRENKDFKAIFCYENNYLSHRSGSKVWT